MAIRPGVHTEYRVVWQRVGCRRKVKRFGGRPSAEKFMTLFGPEPWTYYADKGKGADDLVCCTGSRECGCGGETYRERSEAQRARQPGLVYVRLEARPSPSWIKLETDAEGAAVLSNFTGRNAA